MLAISEESSEQTDDNIFEKLFDVECTRALSFGMSYDEFWCGEPEIYRYYAEVFVKREKDRFASDDLMAWMIGSYVDAALGNNLSAMFSKTPRKNSLYPESPVFAAANSEEAKRKRDEVAVNKAHGTFLANIRLLNRKAKAAS